MMGERIQRVEVNPRSRNFLGLDVRQLLVQLPDRVMTSWETHGKRMLFGFDAGLWLGVHLGMTGKLYVSDLVDDAYAHFVLYTSSGGWVFSDPRQFGKITIDICDDKPLWWRKLPPCILSEAFTLQRMQAFLKRRTRAPIKSVLLMQDAFPGVGNWMADEVCWRSRIDPRRLAGSLSIAETERMFNELCWVCEQAMTTIAVDYRDPPEEWLFRHRWRDGGMCPKTGMPLVREGVGGRTTCWSPAWQW